MEQNPQETQNPIPLRKSTRQKRSPHDTTYTYTPITTKKIKPITTQPVIRNIQERSFRTKLEKLEYMANESARIILILAQKNKSLNERIEEQTDVYNNKIHKLEEENKSIKEKIQKLERSILFTNEIIDFPLDNLNPTTDW